ncbi:MAG: methyl-galactoside transport system substrate-binding protein [Clostridiales bacterium]|nr:methyl-galactoside transport system substrate-binding protein [Clostridiales bacterium]
MILCLVLCVNLSSCKLNGDSKKNTNIKSIKIGVSVYDYYDTFISELIDSFETYIKEMEAKTGTTISLDIENASTSQSLQNSQVEDFINNGCDVICVNLVDRTDPTMIIDRAKSANIPVIFFNRELVEEDLDRWDSLYYVGAVTLESGIMEGELITDACNKDFTGIDKNTDGILQYVILEGEAGHQDAIVRTEYSVNTVTQAGYKVEKLGYAIANWNRAQAQTKMTQWLDQFGNQIEVVISNNDDMALGAIDAYQARGIKKEELPVIVGIDGTLVGLEAVRQGTLLGTVLNDRKGQARAIAELSFSLVTKKDLPDDIKLEEGRYIRLPHQKVTIKNLQEVMGEE